MPYNQPEIMEKQPITVSTQEAKRIQKPVYGTAKQWSKVQAMAKARGLPVSSFMMLKSLGEI